MASSSFPDVQSSGRLSPSPLTSLLGVAHFDFEFWVEWKIPRTIPFFLS